jgi:hypothetical protein
MQLMEKELMSRDLIEFRITGFEAHVPGGLPVMWRGCEISTGPLHFGLDDSTGTSCGMMNYELGLPVGSRDPRRLPERLAGFLAFQPRSGTSTGDSAEQFGRTDL